MYIVQYLLPSLKKPTTLVVGVCHNPITERAYLEVSVIDIAKEPKICPVFKYMPHPVNQLKAYYAPIPLTAENGAAWAESANRTYHFVKEANNIIKGYEIKFCNK